MVCPFSPDQFLLIPVLETDQDGRKYRIKSLSKKKKKADSSEVS